MILQIKIDPTKLAAEFESREDAIKHIMDVDSWYAEVGFTEKVIVSLVKSLKSDLTKDEIRAIVDEALL